MRRDLPGLLPSFLLDGSSTITPDFEPTPGPLLFLSLLFVQGGGMDLSSFGEKLLSSVRSARNLALLPPATADRPEVPARAAAAAAVARALAGLPPHQRLSLPSNSEEMVSIYGVSRQGPIIEELEENFYEEDFDPVRYVMENIPSEENDVTYFEKQATLRISQLDRIAERLSRHVMEHHQKMVKGMQLVMEVEQDLKVANVICRNGRRHIASSMHEVSRDLIVYSNSKKKKALLDMLPILTELHHALDMQKSLETLVEDGNYFRAFQVLSEHLQVLDSYSELSAVQEMGRGVEAWLGRTLQKLDSLLLGVCQMFKEENYITAVDAYALLGDVAGLAEKIQSFFMQEVLSDTHSVLKDILQEEIGNNTQRNRFTYSDLCAQIPESKFRQCLLKTMDTLFRLMCSYYAIMSFQTKEKGLEYQNSNNDLKHGNTSEKSSGGVLLNSGPTVLSDTSGSVPPAPGQVFVSTEESIASSSCSNDTTDFIRPTSSTSHKCSAGASDISSSTSTSNAPFYQLRKDATAFVSQTLDRGRKNLWQLTTSRVSVLLSCSAVCSTSTFQFLKNYEDLNLFILAGEAFSGVKAIEFRQKLRSVSENYVAAFHRQNIYALKMVLEKENWVKITAEGLQVISLAGLIGDGAPLIVSSAGNTSTTSVLHSEKISDQADTGKQRSGFSYWLTIDNPFSTKVTSGSKESSNGHLLVNGSTVLTDGIIVDPLPTDKVAAKGNPGVNGSSSVLEDENEDLLADFIDEDSQLPSRISKPMFATKNSSLWHDDEMTAQTGSSICLLRLLDKYARLMQKLELVNVEFFKGICQLFGIFYHFIFETFAHQDASQGGKFPPDCLTPRLKAALSKIIQDCDQWIRPQNQSSSSSPRSMNSPFTQMDVMPTIPSSTMLGHAPNTSFGLKERCAGAEAISLVARVLHRSKAHLHSMLLQNNVSIVEDFFGDMVDSVSDLTEHIHRSTARMLLHINGYADKIANAKWEVKDLGLEHNGYVDLLLGEFKYYKTRLAHGGISKEVQDLLLEYGLENVADILIEGLSRVKKCTDEGRVLMSLDLQVLINGLQHFVSINVKPKLQVVETFIKAYYLPETEYVHWARSHPEYNRSQIVGLINLVAAMKGWKRKTRLEVLERIEAGN